MKVEAIMKRQVQTCRADQTLNEAVQIFWDRDCGVVPVVDGEGRLVGILTDRDVAVTAYFRGDSLKCISVADAMGRNVLSVRKSDDLEDALELMRTHQVRRLPVVDPDGRVEGILSLSDFFHAAVKDQHLKPKKLVRAFAAICGWREDKRTVIFDVDLKPAKPAKDSRQGKADAKDLFEPKTAPIKAKSKAAKAKSGRSKSAAR